MNKVFGVVSCVIFLTRASVQTDQELCRNPSVYSVDRLLNKTVRFYRENDYWDLNGFPDQTTVTKGSLSRYEFFTPVNKTSRITTILEGSDEIKGRTFKFAGQYWWSWYDHPKFGLRYTTTSIGLYWDQAPAGHGFSAIFHNGDPSEPMLIALEADPKSGDQNMKIHYFGTETETFVRKSSNYFDEKDFPKDMTDAFSWPPSDGSKYNVYITKEDQYCLLTDQQKCTDWKPISELIGCSGTPGGSRPGGKPSPPGNKPIPPGEVSKSPSGGRTKPEGGGDNETTDQTKEPEAEPTADIGNKTSGKSTTKRSSAGRGSKGSGSGSQSVRLSVVSIILSYVCLTFI